MLTPERTVFVLVDVQTKLTAVMPARHALVENLVRLLRGVRLLDVPVLWVEQTPDKMGPTIPELAKHLDELRPVVKHSFGCWGEPAFRKALDAVERGHILLAGIETHVCVAQTTLALLEHGYAVDVAADGCASRTEDNRRIGLQRMQQAGAAPTSVETALFELLGSATHPRFREILRLVK
jgi:nicotinamidase-related amidase